ncbi:MAG: hypothetical protein SWH61_16590 [Thermodesulfobacteriota bacterium]|nr:hypothetical protein [Thermodesulfobacteriota bacterium]
MQTADHYSDEIELIDVIRVLWKRRYLILAIVLCVAIIVPAALWVKFPGHHVATATIALNFKGISEHKNPDGSVFKEEQLIAPVVLNNAFEKFETFVDRDIAEYKREIINSIDVTPVVPDKVEKRIANAEKSGEVFTYYPNQYIISCDGMTGVLSGQEQAFFVKSVIEAYTTFFQQEYKDVPLLTIDFPDNFLEENDYIDIVQIFDQAIERMLALVTPRINQAGLYRIAEQGYTFYRLKSELEFLQETKLPKVSAHIEQRQISKNADSLMKTYEYKIAQLEVEKEKLARKAQVSHDLLKEMNRRVVTDGRQGLGKGSSETPASFLVDASFIESLKKNESIDYLLKTYMEAQVKANNVDVDIAAYKDKIVALQEDNRQFVSPADITYVKTALSEIQAAIITYSNIANKLNIEFLTKQNEHAVALLTQPRVKFMRGVSISKISLLAVFCSIFLAVFAAFLVEYIANAKVKEVSSKMAGRQDHAAGLTEVEIFSKKSGRTVSNS